MNRALLIDPDNLVMRYKFACALATSLGNPDAALDMLEPVLERDPGGNLDCRWLTARKWTLAQTAAERTSQTSAQGGLRKSATVILEAAPLNCQA
jgi:hypothetical protein